ncbi:MAG: 3-phosphoshikimate 1-carboxyvinyltransferase, partial [Oscillospiraceae bacterium]|nr:3-phosphoshikimate 1-carboxyvinyltransferase [Oscillospiraceae bacterium]
MIRTVTAFPRGEIRVPPSKSLQNRAVVCAYLAGDTLEVENPSEDIAAITRCMKALTGEGESVRLDCGESGSALRFLLPIAAALGKNAKFTGRGRLLERPMEVFLAELRRHGVKIEQTLSDISVWGKLKPGKYTLPGDISSQFITGLLFALPL